MTIEEFSRTLADFTAKFGEHMRADAPKIIANKAVMLFKNNFLTESFFGNKWQEVQRRIPQVKTYRTKSGKIKTKLVKGKGADARRKILTGTGDLGRSITSHVNDYNVTIMSNLPYSSAHNDGTDNAGRGRSTRLPQRQFIGEHEQVFNLTEDTIITFFYKDLGVKPD